MDFGAVLGLHVFTIEFIVLSVLSVYQCYCGEVCELFASRGLTPLPFHMALLTSS